MRYTVTADTDVGIFKSNNQDSVVVKHAATSSGEVLMAIVCDGMGGLSKGELASATVVREFAGWFENSLPHELKAADMQAIGERWSQMLQNLNIRLQQYAARQGISLGTTFSGILFIGDSYLIVHVGDSRIYSVTNRLQQLTQDQTFIARELSRGTMTPEQAKTDPRRNMLLQCVGASKTVVPQILHGKIQKGVYFLCSDGFRHVITPEEIFARLRPEALKDAQTMHSNSQALIELVKSRQEKDNITVVLIRVC